MERQCAWCTICGAPISDFLEDDSWLCRVTLLSESEPQSTERSDLIQRAASDVNNLLYSRPYTTYETNGTTSEKLSSGQVILEGSGVKVQVLQRVSTYHPLFIPTHKACLDIAKQVIRSINPKSTISNNPQVTSIQVLLNILKARFLASVVRSGWRFDQLYVHSPQSYFIRTSRRCWGENDEPLEKVYEADPTRTEKVSEFIGSLLQPFPENLLSSASTTHHHLTRHLNNLPENVLFLIIKALGPIYNLPLQCTRVLSPHFWKMVLFDFQMIPYLSQLDEGEFMSVLTKDVNSEWDFELLVREISQVGFWELGGGREKDDRDRLAFIDEPPPSLRNRRRIWRCVEEMRLDDMKSKIMR